LKDKHAIRQTDKQTNRQTDKQTNRQTDKQTSTKPSLSKQQPQLGTANAKKSKNDFTFRFPEKKVKNTIKLCYNKLIGDCKIAHFE
jgi:hypothetical protein